jgi:hypothetical protein
MRIASAAALLISNYGRLSIRLVWVSFATIVLITFLNWLA